MQAASRSASVAFTAAATPVGRGFTAKTAYAVTDSVEAEILPLKPHHDAADVTVYHSTELPSVPLRTLPFVLLELCPEVTPEACVAALVLLERYAERVRPVEATMMHRLFVGCAVVAMKSVQEFFPRNSYVAGRMGIGRWEVNRLEAAVLRDLDWRVVVTLEELDRIVLRRCAAAAAASCDSPRCRSETPELAVMPTPAASSLATSQDVSPGATASASGRAAAAPVSPMSPLDVWSVAF